MKNKFLTMTFMALCLSTSSVVHAMHKEGDEQSACAPVLFSGKYKIEGGSVSVYQADKGILDLQVNLEDTPAVRHSINPKILSHLLKLGKSDLPKDNCIALHHSPQPFDPKDVVRYYGKKTLDGFKMLFDFTIIDTPARGPGSMDFSLQIRIVSIMPSIRFTLLKEADGQLLPQTPSSSSSTLGSE